MKKKLIIIGILLIIASLSASAYFWLFSKDYVATVNDIKATKEEYIFLLNMVKNKIEENSGLNNDKAKHAFWDESSLSGKKNIEKAKKETLEKLKLVKIQYSKAKEASIKLTEEELKKAQNEFDLEIKKVVGNGDSNIYTKSEYGIGVVEFKKIFEEMELISKFTTKEKEKMSVTPEEIEEYYKTNKKLFDRVTIRHILLSVVDEKTQELVTPEQKEASKKKAENLLKKIKEGDDMRLLALEFSQDPSVISNEGELVVDVNSNIDELKYWALEHEVGDIAIVNTKFGYHVARVEKFSKFEDVKEKVKESIFEERYLKLLDQWAKEPKYNIVSNQNVINSIEFPK